MQPHVSLSKQSTLHNNTHDLRLTSILSKSPSTCQVLGIEHVTLFCCPQSSCFICGIGKDYLDKIPRGFESHCQKEHNFANYMFFLMHLINKPDTEYTGQVWMHDLAAALQLLHVPSSSDRIYMYVSHWSPVIECVSIHLARDCVIWTWLKPVLCIQETYVWELYQQRSWDFIPVGDCFRKQYEDEIASSSHQWSHDVIHAWTMTLLTKRRLIMFISNSIKYCTCIMCYRFLFLESCISIKLELQTAMTLQYTIVNIMNWNYPLT